MRTREKVQDFDRGRSESSDKGVAVDAAGTTRLGNGDPLTAMGRRDGAKDKLLRGDERNLNVCRNDTQSAIIRNQRHGSKRASNTGPTGKQRN